MKSAYDLLLHHTSMVAPREPLVAFALHKQRKSLAPSKVIAFALRLLLNRLLTWENLFRRQVIIDVNKLFLCRGHLEM